ncbi:MAG: asparagine synthase-related protein [Chloroflexota bacterium]|nr:asparagine synthase-related protein [Chloroflexota bacterium]
MPRPQVASRGGIELVFDGVLYDSTEFTRALGLVSGASEADLLLNGYLRHGDALLPRLRGRFSIILWNASKRELLAIRDPVGIRPLFHARGDGGLLVSPFLDRLLRQPGVEREVDVRVAAGQMIVGLPAAPEETTFTAVHRVPAGHVLRARGHSTDVHRYWEPASPGTECSEPSEQFGALLDRAVRRCDGGGRFGVAVSGGLDSATIATAAARLSRDRGLKTPCAISLLNPTPEADEEPMQRAVAAELGLTLLAAGPDDEIPPGRMLAAALALAPVSSWPPGLLAPLFDVLAQRAVDRGCETVLTGDGGDEWLLPLSSWAADRLLHLDLPALLAMLRAWPYSYPGMRSRDLTRALLWTWGARPLLRGVAARALTVAAPHRFRRLRMRTIASAIPDWLVPSPARRLELIDWGIERTPEVPLFQLHRAEKHRLLSASFVSGLMEEAFTTGRRLGVEILSPLWDVDLIGFLLSIPEKILIRGGRAKALARDYIAPDLPFAETWPSKTFADSIVVAAVNREGRTAWRELGGAPTLARLGIVDADQVSGVLAKHRNGSPLPGATALWEMMALESWLRSRILPV